MKFRVWRCAIFIFCPLILFLLWTQNIKFRRKDTPAFQENELQMACKLPILDPLAPNIMSIMTSYRPLPENLRSCMNRSRMKFYSDLNGNLLLAQYLPNSYLDVYNCSYVTVRRKTGDDTAIIIDTDIYQISNRSTHIPSSHEFIYLTCKEPKTNIINYEDFYGFVHRKPIVERRAEALLAAEAARNPEVDQYNVVIIGLDSVSHMNYQRYMTRTRNFLNNELSAIEFYGRNKVEESTFGNLSPTLMGWNNDETEQVLGYWPDPPGTKFDDCPFIWKNFEAKGYRILYGEDAIEYSIWLDSTLNGFHKPIADYDFRTLLRAHEIHTHQAGGCFEHQHSSHILLHSVAQAASALAGSLYFHFTWISMETHNHAQGAGLTDAPLHDLLMTLRSQNFLKNTIFILMSDHGMTFGKYVQLEQGMLESRMPMLNIVFPESFRQKFPLAVTNVAINAHRLTSPYDLHEMLRDLVDVNRITNEAIKKRQMTLQPVNGRGISLFLEVSKNRTCKMAGIGDHWCVCGEKRLIPNPVTNPLVAKAVKQVLKVINENLKPFRDFCAPLELESIRSGRRILSGDDEDLEKEKIEIIFVTNPSEGVFQSTVVFDSSSQEISLGNTISRINAYGHQGDCIDNHPNGTLEIKPFCYCLNHSSSGE